MNTEERLPAPNGTSPFERIRRSNAAGPEYWSSRDFAQILGYSDYRNSEQVIRKAKTACFNSGHRVEDHFGDITEMVLIGSGASGSRYGIPKLGGYNA
jgi:DNA-damage-inducible protein D